MVAVTAVPPVPGMPLLAVVRSVVLVPAAASMLGVCVGPPLLDGSVASVVRAILGSMGAVLGVLVGVTRVRRSRSGATVSQRDGGSGRSSGHLEVRVCGTPRGYS